MESICSICYDDLTELDEHESMLSCQHDSYFHPECLEELFNHSSVCPICEQPKRSEQKIIKNDKKISSPLILGFGDLFSSFTPIKVITSFSFAEPIPKQMPMSSMMKKLLLMKEHLAKKDSANKDTKKPIQNIVIICIGAAKSQVTIQTSSINHNSSLQKNEQIPLRELKSINYLKSRKERFFFNTKPQKIVNHRYFQPIRSWN